MLDGRLSLTVLSVTAAVALGGCAGDMPVAACASLDWRMIGETDGRSGLRAKEFDEHAKKCADGAADRVAYEAGRASGLQFYCTRAGGLAAGAIDADYEETCAPETEAAFLAGYALGEKLYVLTKANRKAIAAYAKAESSLDQHRYLLRTAEKRAEKPSIDNEQRELARQDAVFRQSEINRLEGSLLRLVDEIEATRAALDAYKAELAAMGLVPPDAPPATAQD